MTTIQLTLNIPDSLAKAANNAGLLEPTAIETLLRQAVKHKAIDELFAADQLTVAEINVMTLEARVAAISFSVIVVISCQRLFPKLD